MPDYRALYDNALAARLGPGERVLALSEARRPRGLAPEPPPRQPVPAPDPAAAATKTTAIAAADLVISGVDFGDSLGSTTAPFDWARRLVWGRAAAGPLDSLAGRYATQVPPGRHLVVVTERRLLIFRTGRRSGYGNSARPVAAAKLTALWEAPRTEITNARVRWHRLHGARLRVEFRDGSWLELTGPLCLGRRRALALRGALAE